MKIITTLFTICALFIFTQVNAQQVSEEIRNMNLGDQNAIILDVQDLNKNEVNKLWKDFTSRYGNAKKVKKANEYLMNDIQVIDIGGASRIDLYYRIENMGGGTKVVLWIENDGSFVNSDDQPEAYEGAADLLGDFQHSIKVHLVEVDLADQEKELEKMDKTMDKLAKDRENYHKEIEKARDRIAKMESNLLQNEQDRALLEAEVEAQHALVKEVRNKLDKVKSQGRSGS